MKTLVRLSLVALLTVLLCSAWILFSPKTLQPSIKKEITPVAASTVSLSFLVQNYLQAHNSPLVDHMDKLLGQPNWELLVAISDAESSFCTHMLYNNCWGIGGESALRHYPTLDQAIIEADDLITAHQDRGEWFTPAQMNCHYVVPCSKTWLNTVNRVLNDMEALKEESTQTGASDDRGVGY